MGGPAGRTRARHGGLGAPAENEHRAKLEAEQLLEAGARKLRQSNEILARTEALARLQPLGMTNGNSPGIQPRAMNFILAAVTVKNCTFEAAPKLAI